MQTYTLASVREQVDKIRGEVRTNGHYVAGCEELVVLCPDLFTEEAKAIGLAQIAQWEGWLIERLPDGTARFSLC